MAVGAGWWWGGDSNRNAGASIPVRTSEDECIEALLRAADELGESPTKAQYEELGLTPASATIIRVMGGWNGGKEAAWLATNPSTGTRTKPKPDDVELPDDVEWEDLTVDQRWHYRNIEWNSERTLKRRGRLRSWINGRKRERGCIRCGADDPACLDYHHTDEDEKEMAVVRMITHGYGKDRLREEIAECEVICANCHREVHHGHLPPDRIRDDRPRLQAWVYEYKRATGGCARCDEDNPVCLDFHHVGPEKSRTVASMISDGCSKEEIRAEIAKCTVLCANCHRKEHFVPPTQNG